MFHTLRKRRRQSHFLIELRNEIAGNFERFHVMSQREFVSSAFALEAWEDAKHFSGLSFPDELHAYAAALEDFNRAFTDMRAFEEFYSSSIDHKNRANAEILHAKKELLEQKIGAVQACIISARKILSSLLDKK